LKEDKSGGTRVFGGFDVEKGMGIGAVFLYI
jgi:hypothetical protein